MLAEHTYIDAAQLHNAMLMRIGMLRRRVDELLPARLRPVISPDDILQDVWISAHRTFPRAKRLHPRAFEDWLLKIARSRVTDAVRAARTLKRGGGRIVPQNDAARVSSLCDLFDRACLQQRTPSSEFHREELAQVVASRLELLTPARREVVELRYLKGLANHQIAERLGKTPAAINSLLHKGVGELGTLLGPASKYLSDADSSEGQPQRS